LAKNQSNLGINKDQKANIISAFKEFRKLF